MEPRDDQDELNIDIQRYLEIVHEARTFLRPMHADTMTRGVYRHHLRRLTRMIHVELERVKEVSCVPL